MALLPSFFVLESGGKYLSITANNINTNNAESSVPSGFLKFNEEDIWSPRVKFAVEAAESGGVALVHIRSCYNNKYLVTQQIGNNLWVVASAKKPEEDRTKASCTLFEPQYYSSLSKIRLRHVHTQHYFATYGDTRQGITLISSTSSSSAFRAIDSKSLIVLPTLVAFKTTTTTTNNEEKYLCSRNLDPRWPYQRFEVGHDIGDQRVAKQLFPTANGYYRIKDLYFDKFWRRSPNWIWADAGSDNYSNDTLFSFVKLDDDDNNNNNNVFALKNLGNNYFCGPLTTEGKTNCLNAQYPTLTNQTRLVIQETVLTRKISELKYRLSDSRIYGERNIECDHTFATNDSPDETTNITLKFSISDSKTTNWSNTLSVKFGVNIGFETDIVPIITSGKVELSTEVGYTHEWGGSMATTFNRESSYSVPVPKSTTIKVTMMCTKAACDVPFYYTQTDLLPSGQWVSTIKDDGIFTGVNSYNFRFQSQVVPNNNLSLSPSTPHAPHPSWIINNLCVCVIFMHVFINFCLFVWNKAMHG